jgi:alpha-L-fucosidase
MDEDLGSRSKLLAAKGLIWYPAETDVSIRPGWFYHAAEDGKVRSPENLMDIYFNSVGRNSVLLLNIPPDKDGLISDADRRSLLGWKHALDGSFQTNLAAGAVISSPNGQDAAAMLDDKPATLPEAKPTASWTTTGRDTAATIEFALAGEKTFDILLLQENILIGQRVEKFALDYMGKGGWTTIVEGTTIGYKRLLRFPPVTTEKVRLRILSSRLNPTIAKFGLYKQMK